MEKQTPFNSQESNPSPVAERIEELLQKSKWKRSSPDSPNTTIENNGQTFLLRTIESGDDESVSHIQQLFEKTFGKEEIDPEAILRAAVDGVTATGIPQSKYRIVAVTNENGEIAGTIAGASFALTDASENPTNDMVYFVGYAAMDESTRQGGLAREAYISALIDAKQEAMKQGKNLRFAFGECTASSERFWNNVGWKRIYGKADTGTYDELPYMQPALDFDQNSGAPAAGAGTTPEHLMMDSFGANSPSKDDIMRAYTAFMRYNTMDWSREAFASDEAFSLHQSYMQSLRAEIEHFLESHGAIAFLDSSEREELQSTGTLINNHAGPKNDSVEENLS